MLSIPTGNVYKMKKEMFLNFFVWVKLSIQFRTWMTEYKFAELCEDEGHKAACMMLCPDLSQWDEARRRRKQDWRWVLEWLQAGFTFPPSDNWLDLGANFAMQMYDEFEKRGYTR